METNQLFKELRTDPSRMAGGEIGGGMDGRGFSLKRSVHNNSMYFSQINASEQQDESRTQKA